jgi:putative ABC transport system substrate-binding protein
MTQSGHAHPLLRRLILLGFEKRYPPRVEGRVHRRDFIRAVIGSAAVWPVASGAQQPATPIVGYLGADTPEGFGIRLTAFRQGLSEMGYDEGRNVTLGERPT